MAKIEGPDIVPVALSPEGEALRSLFLTDLDKCVCQYEVFEMEPGKPILYLNGQDFQLAPEGWCRVWVPLRAEPLTTEDFYRCIVAASTYVDDVPLEAKDMIETQRLVPQGSGLEGIEVPGLEKVLAVPEPEYLGQYIQNYKHFGLFIQPHCLGSVA